jgi:hypothetical protein
VAPPRQRCLRCPSTSIGISPERRSGISRPASRPPSEQPWWRCCDIGLGLPIPTISLIEKSQFLPDRDVTTDGRQSPHHTAPLSRAGQMCGGVKGRSVSGATPPLRRLIDAVTLYEAVVAGVTA